MNDQPGSASDDADAGSDPASEPPVGDEGSQGSLGEASAPTDGEAPPDEEVSGGDASDGDASDGIDAESDSGTADGDTTADGGNDATDAADAADADLPPEVRKYERFKKMDGARYERVNEFLRDRTYVTAREWAIARLCADFRTETGVEMTKIGENLPELVPFMTDTYTPQAVNQARYSFEEKVTKAGATFLYGAMSGFFTAEDLDEMMYEVTEVAKFLLEVEGVDLAVADELEAEDKISEVMREVRASSAGLRGEEVRCPECGHVHEPAEE
ncbi:DUF5806 family protein [Halorubrum depositum]|uniref:DUF5806 family protein n=1 Tax=Halorubrum depositum TaxID=2583992 RepID=UPI0011A033A2|nr:DUF5806 family protein [Halorubrum depositum]